ncbi:2-oxo acid dehydrogenase subunit E2 [[Kitasatospora] papulosa]|uniref:2-oxo acid dehydrogenase subunit E2 n=1 Tax=[Kitasatospora] papulosa TaxID=1464011 RepID=UPI00367400FD
MRPVRKRSSTRLSRTHWGLGPVGLSHVSRARRGRLRASETADPSITITSLGDQGVECVFGVIYPPQVALVGLGRVIERPAAVNGLLGVRPTLTATLSLDHRAANGATGARFLNCLDRLLQRPEEL